MKRYGRSNEEISNLCLALSLMLHAGVDAGGGLSLLAQEEPDGEYRALLADMSRQMDGGSPLAAAFRQSGQFPGYVCGLVEVGEQTGRTEEALGALSRYYEERARLDRRLRAVLLYPAVLLLIMLAVVVVLLTQVLPVFNEVYADLGGQLTGVAGGLLRLGRTLDGLMPVLCALLGLAVLLLGLFAGSAGFRNWALSLWQKACGDRGVSRKLGSARFAQALSMGLRSGLSAEEAISLSATLLSDLPAGRKRCLDCGARMEEGDSLAKAMGDAGLLPKADCRLLELGVRSGAGDSVMAQIAQRLSEEGDAALEARLGQVEPTLVVSASLLVGVILLSVMLPLMHIMTAIG